MAGPDRPPWLLPMTGSAPLDIDRHAHQGVDHRESHPSRPRCTRRALPAMSVWFGDSLVISGLSGDRAAGGHHARRHLRVIAEGHAAFLDIRAGDVDLDGVDGRVMSSSRVTSAYSSTVEPETLAMKRVSAEVQRRAGWWFTTWSVPGFCRPIAFSMPPGVSATRCGLVAQTRRSMRGALQADGTDIACWKSPRPGYILRRSRRSRKASTSGEASDSPQKSTASLSCCASASLSVETAVNSIKVSRMFHVVLVPAGDPAQHRQYHTPLRQYRQCPAPDSPAGL